LETFSLLLDLIEHPIHHEFFFPEDFSAPHLQILCLENVDIDEVPSLITSAATSLVSLSASNKSKPATTSLLMNW
jgi:hypothetical protein